MQHHEYTLRPKPFALIASGQKQIELRLNDSKRQQLNVGDVIIFTNTETSQQVQVVVTKLMPYPIFKELYAHTPKALMGYGQEEKANYQDMEVYYSAAAIRKFGVLGIEIRLVDGENI